MARSSLLSCSVQDQRYFLPFTTKDRLILISTFAAWRTREGKSTQRLVKSASNGRWKSVGTAKTHALVKMKTSQIEASAYLVKKSGQIIISPQPRKVNEIQQHQSKCTKRSAMLVKVEIRN
jgi:hypothetical protein